MSRFKVQFTKPIVFTFIVALLLVFSAGLSAAVAPSGGAGIGGGVNLSQGLAETEGSQVVGGDVQDGVPKSLIIPPGHLLYPAKLWIEDIQERLTTNQEKKVLLMQKHIDERIRELKYEAVYNYNKNSDMLVQKVSQKSLRLEGELEKLRPRCVDAESNEIVACNWFSSNKTEAVYRYVKAQNQDVLTRLINDPAMPNASKKGLMNALERSGATSGQKVSRETASQMQPATISVGERTMSFIPFRTAMVYDPAQNRWYSIFVYPGKIIITEDVIEKPDYYVYPTEKQLKRLEEIAGKVNRQGSIGVMDKIDLTVLWWQISKRGG